MATDHEMKLVMDRLDDMQRRLDAKDKELQEAKAAPRAGLAQPNKTYPIEGRCTVCNRKAIIQTDDPSKGKRGFRHVCKCQAKQEALGGDLTTWYMRTDYKPDEGDEDFVQEPELPRTFEGATAARVPKGGSKLEPTGGVSA